MSLPIRRVLLDKICAIPKRLYHKFGGFSKEVEFRFERTIDVKHEEVILG